MTVSPSPRTEAALRLAAFLLASISLLALLAHVAGFIPMPFFLTFFGIPSLFFLFALGALARRINAGRLLDGLMVGTKAGLLATFAYDAARFVVERTHLLGYNGFVPIYIFGSWITGHPPETLAAGLAGWTYHFWNGISFGIMYCLIFGKRHWLFGLGYGIVMECFMLGIFPFFLRVSNKLDFILLSMIGHAVYGAVLGRIAQKQCRY